MRILQERTATTIAYLKYDGWAVFPLAGPLDLTNCILFTEREAALNPPTNRQTYQHWGCYAPIKKERDQYEK